LWRRPAARSARLGGWLKVIAADGPRQHGLILDLAICDELHAHGRRELYDAQRTSMLKRPGARMVTISTAGAVLDTPLGELRERAMKLPKVEREGALTRAYGDHLGMVEWALPADAEVSDLEAVNRRIRARGSRSTGCASSSHRCMSWPSRATTPMCGLA
jgi:hypothetical protein